MSNQIKFKASLEKFEEGLYKYHIKVSDSITETVSSWRKDKRVSISLPNVPNFQAAIMQKHGIHYIMLNQQRRKLIGKELGEEITCTLEKASNDIGISIAPEIQAAFDLDKKAEKYFKQLTPGKQRSLLHIIEKIKNSQLRIDRSLIIAEHLKQNLGKLDFKQLNASFKSSRNN